MDKSSSDRGSNLLPDEENKERRGRRIKMNRRLFFFGEDELEGEAKIVDLSTGGCQATSLTEVKTGLLLKLTLFLDDQPWPLRVDEAIVRWVNGPSFGLEFIGIRSAQRERLRAILMKDKS
jgi:hypothetical protein